MLEHNRPKRGRLEALGYNSYAAYLSSPRWAATKTRYRSSDRPQDCYCCGHDEVDLHHKTYARIGDEHLDDLVPLCRRCHAMVHVLERRGDLTLDLAGLLDAQRAAEGRRHLEQLAERRPEAMRDQRAARQRLLETLTVGQRLDAAMAYARRNRRSVSRDVRVIEKRLANVERELGLTDDGRPTQPST